MSKNINNTAIVSGVDATYYFAKSGTKYDAFYENIIGQVEKKKDEFNALNFIYDNNDIIITINNIDLKLSAVGRDGFYWFRHDFFRIGFKDSEKMVNMHNIRVQLNAIGIYTLGINSLVEYVNTKLLHGALSKPIYCPITRIDVNMFVQHSFTYLRKEMILSRKKTHASNIGERSNGYELETYYVGKRPFLLRIYNKLKELEGASDIKREMMYNYFGINGLDIKKPIFNVEFEYHREILTSYGIDTMEDALSRSKSLFELGCDAVKLIDISELTEKQLNSPNKRRAPLLPIWEFISTNYDNKEFMQIETPLEKVEKITYAYSLEDAKKPLKRLMTRLLLHDNAPTLFFFYEILLNVKEELKQRKDYKAIQAETNNEPNIADELISYSNEGLLNYEERLYQDLQNTPYDTQLYKDLSKVHQEIEKEIDNRGIHDDLF